MKWCFLCVAIAAISACAAPGGQLKPEDAVWRESTLPAPWNRVFEQTVRGFETCDPIIPRCFVYPESRFAVCELYMRPSEGGTSAFVFGLMEVRALDDGGTRLKLGIHRPYAEEARFKRWRSYADGVYECLPNGGD